MLCYTLGVITLILTAGETEAQSAFMRLHLQSDNGVTLVENVFIDQYMPGANGEYVKLYLYLLRCAGTGRELSISSIADFFDHTEKDVRRALTYWEKLSLLKLRYDGYHFSERSEDIYNPFSLFKAFMNKKVSNYWFESGTPTFLIRQMQHFRTDITTLENIIASSSAFDRPTEAMTDALPLLYQSGYLTIKDYSPVSEAYTLSIPNQEVRIGFTEGLLPMYIGLQSDNVKLGFAFKFWDALKSGDIDLALREMQTYFEGLPYIEGFKKKLDDVAKAEGFYEWTFYLIFSMLNTYVRTQVKTIHGRADMVVHMPDTTYVFELKINGTAKEALAQINSRGYAIPYQTNHPAGGLHGASAVVKVGLRFSTETLAIEEWEIEH